MTSHGKRCACRVAVLAAMMIASGVTHGQEIDETTLIDAEQAFQSARQASQAGDFQTAIIALERLLLINPELPNIQFELGLLYKRVGAPRRAEFFLRESLKSRDMPPEIRSRAQRELAELTGVRPTGDLVLNARLTTRYETNPGSVSGERQFFDSQTGAFVPGVSVEQPDSDYSVAGSVGADYTRRFGEASRHRWRSGLSVSSTRYAEQSVLNSSAIVLDGGLSYEIGSDNTRRSILSPFAFSSINFDESDVESNALGGGLRYSRTSALYTFGSTLEAVATNYRESAALSDSNRVSGGVSFGFRNSSTSRLTFQAGLTLASLDAERGFESYNEADIRYNIAYSFRSLASSSRASLSLSLGARLRRYSEFDFQISDTEKRKEDRPQVGLTLNIPLDNGFRFSAGLQSFRNLSNLPNFRYRNTTASIGFGWRF